MVMRYRHEDPGWWENLPPRIRERFAAPLAEAASGESAVATQVAEPQSFAKLGWLRDSSILAMAFLAVALANVILLLVLVMVDGVAAPAP